ncbi:hypothetical protein FOL46_009102, partial [Perkinsus olseni]
STTHQFPSGADTAASANAKATNSGQKAEKTTAAVIVDEATCAAELVNAITLEFPDDSPLSTVTASATTQDGEGLENRPSALTAEFIFQQSGDLQAHNLLSLIDTGSTADLISLESVLNAGFVVSPWTGSYGTIRMTESSAMLQPCGTVSLVVSTPKANATCTFYAVPRLTYPVILGVRSLSRLGIGIQYHPLSFKPVVTSGNTLHDNILQPHTIEPHPPQDAVEESVNLIVHDQDKTSPILSSMVEQNFEDKMPIEIITAEGTDKSKPTSSFQLRDLPWISDARPRPNLGEAIARSRSLERQLPVYQRALLQGTFQDLLSSRVLQVTSPSELRYFLPVRPVYKRGAGTSLAVTVRLTVDGRKINGFLRAGSADSSSSIAHCLTIWRTSPFYRSLDLSSAFHGVSLSEEAQKYCGLALFGVVARWLRMPFGIRNAPATLFQVLSTLLSTIKMEWPPTMYVDDLGVIARTIEELDHNESTIVQTVQAGGFNFQDKKRVCSVESCGEFGQLGYRWRLADAVPHLRDQNGSSNLDRTITDKQTEEFENWVEDYRQPQRLTHGSADEGESTTAVYPLRGIGGIVTQDMKSWSTPKLELYALYRACVLLREEWQVFSDSAITVYRLKTGGHKVSPVEAKWLGYIRRFCQEFRIKVYHIQSHMNLADGPSRGVSPPPPTHPSRLLQTLQALSDGRSLVTFDPEDQGPGPAQAQATLGGLNECAAVDGVGLEDDQEVPLGDAIHVDANDLKRHQDQSMLARAIIGFLGGIQSDKQSLPRSLLEREAPLYSLQEGILYRATYDSAKVALFPSEDPSFVDKLIDAVHERLGHAGPSKLVQVFTSRYYAPKLATLVRKRLKTCDCCQRINARRQHQKTWSRVTMRGMKPFQVFGLDHMIMIDGRDETDGRTAPYKAILTLTCGVSSFTICRAVKTCTVKETIS